MNKRRYAELILVVAGASLLIKGGWDLANYTAFQSHPEWFVHATKPSSPLLPISVRSNGGLNNLSDLQVLGRVEVPRLGMSVLVVEGDNEEKLGLAAGHMPGSAALGQSGNAVIAGHRDTSFWPLRKIRIGDRVRVRSSRTYEYIVNDVRIVKPDDVSVLSNTKQKTLTLVTCYPFRYFGSAPQRFIVQATIASR